MVTTIIILFQLLFESYKWIEITVKVDVLCNRVYPEFFPLFCTGYYNYLRKNK